MNAQHARFPAISRLLHWSMAAMIVTQLFLGLGMAATLSKRYPVLASVHRPLGLLILILVVLRLANRWINPPPPLPETLPPIQRLAAKGSHIVLYALMIVMPLLGWGMLSAAPYPIKLAGPLTLPPILPQSPTLYAWLRELHTLCGLLLLAVILIHLGAALFHALIRRDGVFQSMASWTGR